MATKKKAARPAVKMSKSSNTSAQFCGIACSCPLFGVVTTRAFWSASVVAFAVSMAFDMYWHGQLLMPNYEATAAMWRPMAEMQSMMYYCFAFHAALAMSYSALVLLMGRTCSWWGGLITGVLASAPMAVSSAGAFMHLPFGSDSYIPMMWTVGSLIQGALVGVAITAVTRVKCLCDCK